MAITFTPADAIVLTLVVQLDDAEGILGLNDHIPEIFAGTGHQEILFRQLRYDRADRTPFAGGELFLHGLNFLCLDAIGKVSSVSLVPALLPSVVSHSHKSFYKFRV